MKRILGFCLTLALATGLKAQDSTSSKITLIEKLQPYVASVIGEFDQIEKERRQQLEELSELTIEHDQAALTFICTHNSRRSQLAQVWAAVAANYYGLTKVKTYSGGTEATAFNPRAVKALIRAGFNLHRKGEQNPLYRLYYSADVPPVKCYSKKYDNKRNPQSNFIAVMVCSDADEACPVVDGATARIAIPYIDPKASDGTFMEKDTYDTRCRQIAREMFYLMAKVAQITSAG